MRFPKFSRKAAGVGIVPATLAAAALIMLGCTQEPQGIVGPTSDAGLAMDVAKASSSAGTVGFRATFLERIRRPQSDKFTITNNSEDGIKISEVVVDLRGSRGHLFFDTLPTGPGEGVFFLLKTNDGWRTGLTSVSGLRDGGTSVRFTFDNFNAGDTFEFFIDVDSPARGLAGDLVLGSLFAGSRVTVRFRPSSGGVTLSASKEVLSATYRASGLYSASCSRSE